MTVLIASASKHGATQEIAEEIGRVLAQAGIATDVRRIEEVHALDTYQALVLGSAVYMGRWMDSAAHFIADHGAAMIGRPVWLFSSGPIGEPPHPDEAHAVHVEELVAASGAREHRLFAGRLDKHLLSFGERAVMVAVRAPEGDFRDWALVADWASEVAEALSDA